MRKMNKKMVGAICAIIMMISGGICTFGYVLGNSNDPWWLVAFAGGILCAIVSMALGAKYEKDKNKKHKAIIGCICASISMISVFAFLVVQIITAYENSWLIVFAGGILSGIIYMIDNARNEKGE
jgi:uncharacterized membrane protein YfcA